MSRIKVIKYIRGKEEARISLKIERNGTQIQIVTPANYHGAKIKKSKSVVLKDGKIIVNCSPGDYSKAMADLRTLLGVVEINTEAPKTEKTKADNKD